MGHANVYMFRPSVAPFFGAHDRDLAQSMPRGVAYKNPVILPAAVGCGRGTAIIPTRGRVLHQNTPMFTVRQLPRPRPGKPRGLLVLVDQTPCRVGSTTRLSDHDDLAHPGWGSNVLQHLPQQEVLRPTTLRVNRRQGHRDATGTPARHPHYPLNAKRLRSVRTLARGGAQGVFPPPLLVQRTLSHAGEEASCRGRKRAARGRRHRGHQGRGIPVSRPNQPQSRPLAERRRQVRSEPLESPLAWIANPGDHSPTKDQKRPRLGAGKVPLARVAHLRYCAWETCTTPQMSRSWVCGDVGYSQQTQECLFVQSFLGDRLAQATCHPSLLSKELPRAAR
jgi:hypothetical protein